MLRNGKQSCKHVFMWDAQRCISSPPITLSTASQHTPEWAQGVCGHGKGWDASPCCPRQAVGLITVFKGFFFF